MTKKVGNNRNFQDTSVTTTVTVNSLTATVLAPANPDRLWVRISLDSGTLNQEVFVREYPAATDNNKAGELLIREISSNHSLFKPCYYTFADNVYTGEISGIADAGTFNVHVTEG